MVKIVQTSQVGSYTESQIKRMQASTLGAYAEVKAVRVRFSQIGIYVETEVEVSIDKFGPRLQVI